VRNLPGSGTSAVPLSRLATHFAIFYPAFSHKSAIFHAKQTGKDPEEKSIKRGNHPQPPTTSHKCRAAPANPHNPSPSQEIVHNCRQTPAIPKENGRTIEDSSPAIRFALITI
jgi:hypothetical protein